jgi:hypothetical protein
MYHAQVDDDGSLMTCVDRVGCITGVGASECVVPFRCELCTGRNSDHFVRDVYEWIRTAVADYVVGGDIRNWLKSKIE